MYKLIQSCRPPSSVGLLPFPSFAGWVGLTRAAALGLLTWSVNPAWRLNIRVLDEKV
jgi:hypothetical protein